MFRSRRGQSGGNLGIVLLAAQLYNFGFERIPPVTLVAILSQCAIFLGFGDLDRWFPSSYEVCMSTHLVLQQKQWNRLILSAFYHANDMHLYFNMVSLLWKGVMLEKKFKSQYFAFMLAVFTALSSVTYVILNRVMAQLFGDSSYELQCAVGFSGVIFGLKVLTTHYSPRGLHYALGFIPVPSRYIYWVELGLIQLIHPNASFTGHLAGILVGLLYIKGPLKYLMDSIMPPGRAFRDRAEESGYYQWRGHTTGGASAPRASAPRAEYGGYNHSRDDRATGDDYYNYTGGLSEEEQIRQATERSMRDNTGAASSNNRLYPDLDELRNRRANRYS